MKWRYMSRGDSNYMDFLLKKVVGQLGYISLFRVHNHADVVLAKGKKFPMSVLYKGVSGIFNALNWKRRGP